ncbi:MAG TPA: hypothetical protein DIW47_07255 [Bacteroidetes bacterium]|nr:hypothetical protein [Bacteroidota bacterium]
MKYFKAILYTLVLLVCLYLLYAIYVSDTQGANGSGFGITVIFVLGALSIGAAIVFPIMYMISHPKSAIRTLIGVGLVFALFGIGWALSGNEVLLAYEEVNFTSASGSKLIGGSLIMMYLMIAAVLGVTIFAEVKSIFK